MGCFAKGAPQFPARLETFDQCTRPGLAILQTPQERTAPGRSRDLVPGERRHLDDTDATGEAFGHGSQQCRRTRTGDHEPPLLRAILVYGHPQCGKDLRQHLGFVDRHLSWIKAEERIRIARNDEVIGAAFEIEMPGGVGERFERCRLSALAYAEQRDTGKGLEIRPQPALVGTFHTMHFQTITLKMRGIVRRVNRSYRPCSWHGMSRFFSVPNQRNMLRMKQYAVLFCCTGNICRSPTAEGVFLQKVADAKLTGRIRVDSAGTHGYHVGEAPDPRAQAAARARGYDLSGLRARRVEREDFKRFDLVLAMDHYNRTFLAQLSPPAESHKLRLIMEYARRHAVSEVPDPYDGGSGDFAQVLEMLEDATEGLLQAIRSSKWA